VMPRSRLLRLGFLLLIALVVAGCLGGAAQSLPPGVTAPPTPTPPAGIPLNPTELKPDPFSLLSWLFTPIFQAFFIGLAVFDRLTGNVAVAIILLTILIKVLLIPIFRRQLVSTRRMQLIAPELKEVQRRYKGDRMKVQQATAQLYKERGVSPLGCLPIFLQMFLLIPLYSVFSQGLTNFDVQPMLNVFGFQILDMNCPAAPVFGPNNTVLNPCMNPNAWGVNWGVPEVFIGWGQPGTILSGISLLAIASSILQFIASRMTLPPVATTAVDDPNIRMQRQMAIFLPFISLIYGTILPAGLFLYWIVSTIFSIVQQYLILGWGGMFPIFGWTPRFAVDHTPRFPVAMPVAPTSTSRAAGAPARPTNDRSALDRSASAQATIRQRGRQGRRGRRR
jgi:YidC/Oxa1 family membrane protein insertase